MNCKQCGKPVEHAIEGELICRACWIWNQMSDEEREFDNIVKACEAEQAAMVSEARGLMNRLYGGVTRESGFARALSEFEVVDLCTRSGYLWNGDHWVNVGIEDAKAESQSVSEIWG